MFPGEENCLIDKKYSQRKERIEWPTQSRLMAQSSPSNSVSHHPELRKLTFPLAYAFPRCQRIYIQQVPANIHPSNDTNRCPLYLGRKQSGISLNMEPQDCCVRLHRLLSEDEMDKSYTFACPLLHLVPQVL